MATFDPIATPAKSAAEHLEPAFAHPEQAAAAKQRLSKYVERRGRLPNSKARTEWVQNRASR